MKFNKIIEEYMPEQKNEGLIEGIKELKQKYEIPISDRTSDEIKIGINIEKEHDNLYNFLKEYMDIKEIEFPLEEDEFYEWIAAVHLKELDDYYTRLEKMEEEGKKEQEEIERYSEEGEDSVNNTSEEESEEEID